jgi:outer membrane protein OmpA-like peptidoglycan-associated protein
MQGKDPFLMLLGVFILGLTFFFCGKGAVTSPPPVALEHPAEHPSLVSKINEPPPSAPPTPAVSGPATAKKKIDDLLIGQTIPFRINSATLLSDGKVVLNRVAAILHENPTVAVEISGRTDNGGPEHGNQMLSEQRAKAIIEYLITQGITAERLIPKGYDASRSLAANATDEERRQNRRMELSVGTTGEQP